MGINALRQFRRDDQIAALPRIAKLLDPQHEDRPENRTAAARICGSLKSDAAPALAMLQAAAMNDPDAKVRGPALVAIAQIAAPEQAVSSLSKGLKDNDAAVRLVAAVRLRQLGVQAAPAVHELAAVLADSNNDVAESAAETLILIGTPAVQPVAEQLSSRNVSARKLALACLAKIGVAAKETVPKIEACQRDADPQVRQLAEAALKRIRGQ
jgi:HEAT repeat protein